jgi:Zn-dependent metalloprotease
MEEQVKQSTTSEVVEKNTSRSERRRSKHISDSEALRRAKRAARYKTLVEEAKKIRKRKPKNFKKDVRFVQISAEIKKIWSFRGESNYTPPKKKRK